MTTTVYTDQSELSQFNGDWYIVEFDGTVRQLSCVAGVEQAFRIKDIVSPVNFCGLMNLNGKIYDLKEAENPFCNTPVILEWTPGSYINRNEDTDMFFVKAWEPFFLQHMPTLPDNCKYIRAFKLDNNEACIIRETYFRPLNVTKVGTCETKEKPDIPGMSMQLMDDKVLKFAKDISETFERDGHNIQYIQLKEPSLTWFKELAERYVKEHERRTL